MIINDRRTQKFDNHKIYCKGQALEKGTTYALKIANRTEKANRLYYFITKTIWGKYEIGRKN